jgi:uncharacterized membrane protein SirB2
MTIRKVNRLLPDSGISVNSYLALKHLHITCAALSGSFFALRGAWMLRASPLLQKRWVKVVPHVVDTVLLGSAVWMAVISSQYPFVFPWLTAKLVALVAYIGLGMVALRFGKTPGTRLVAYVAALLVFAYIVSVALHKQPIPF